MIKPITLESVENSAKKLTKTAAVTAIPAAATFGIYALTKNNDVASIATILDPKPAKNAVLGFFQSGLTKLANLKPVENAIIFAKANPSIVRGAAIAVTAATALISGIVNFTKKD